ncbi:Transcriptional regulator, LacI family [hydrothermal vent metagenome]|uniref:Transcriptional regulator, LacI family n=1 Tax=hydrothermal vent metagenome TaxID=652676 RepID=A0A3B1BE30_9ZZZZ
MAATLKDVAARAGVHPSTVSRVLRKQENLKILDTTRKRIFDAVKALNYQPDFTARALRMKKSFTIGLIVPDIGNPFFSRITRTIEQLGFEKDYTVIVCNTDENQAKEDRYVNHLLSRGIDGLIMVPAQDSDESINKVLEHKVPLVLIDRLFENIKTNAVISNNVESAYNAVKHLVDLGHKKVAFLRGRNNIYTMTKRFEGYQKAVDEFGLVKSDSLIVGNGFSFNDGYDATTELLNCPEPPTALLLTGNLITVGAISAILAKGLKIPEDISVVAFADSIFSPYLVKPLTTISHPLYEIGSKAFNLLLEHIESGEEELPPTQIMINTQFDIRETTGKAKAA